jgi:hypothetical protein
MEGGSYSSSVVKVPWMEVLGNGFRGENFTLLIVDTYIRVVGYRVLFRKT